MRYAQVKKWTIFICSIIMSGFFIWFGFLLLKLATREISTTQLFALGSACVLAAVFSVSNVKKYNVVAAAALLATGIYYFARTAGYIESPILIRLLGLASWTAAALLLYLTYPNRESSRVSPATSSDES